MVRDRGRVRDRDRQYEPKLLKTYDLAVKCITLAMTAPSYGGPEPSDAS